MRPLRGRPLGNPPGPPLWSRQRWGWGKPEWISLVLVFGLLLLHPLLNGHPFLFGDSWAYCCRCPDQTRSPVLGCLLGPVVAALGIWAYAAIQCAVTAFALVFLSGILLQRSHSRALIVALGASGVGIFAGWVLADIWTLIGFICLFALAAGRAYPALAALLVLSCATHFGNFPTFAATAFLMLPFLRERLKFALRASLCIAAALALVAAANLTGGVLKFSSGNGMSFLASRILHDIPEVLEDLCRDEPGFGLCGRKDDLRRWCREDPGSFFWTVAANLSLGLDEMNEFSRRIVVYSLSKFPGYYPEHLEAALGNALRLFAFYEISDGHVPCGQDPYVLDSMQACLPGDSEAYRNSLQGDGRLQGFLKRLDGPLTALFWLAVFICALSAVACRASRHNDALIQLAIFALIAVGVNAFFMSNLSGVFSRYHTRLGFLLIFPGVALSSRGAGRLVRRIRDQSMPRR